MSTWYAVPTGGGQHLSPAGWWLVYVSLPLFQFILFRWYFRLFVWVRFLWQVARCELSLVPTHPDRAGGLGFLSLTVVAFAPVLLAHGVLLSGLIADRIFFHGASLLDFKAQVAVVVVFLLSIVLGPLLLFTPHLGAARRVGLREYGTLAQRYVREFDDKWLRGGAPADEPLVGSADIQSLADLGNSFELVRSMRTVPFTRDTLVQLAAITLLPLVPLAPHHGVAGGAAEGLAQGRVLAASDGKLFSWNDLVAFSLPGGDRLAPVEPEHDGEVHEGERIPTRNHRSAMRRPASSPPPV